MMEENADHIEAQWWAATNAGNKAIDQGDERAAQHYYEAALATSERLFEAAWTEDSACLLAPMTCNIAAHNLAELNRRNGNDEAAAHALKKGVTTLLTNAENPATPLALRVNCGRHLPRAIAYFDQLCPEASDRADVHTLIARTRIVRRQIRKWAYRWNRPSQDTDMQTVH